MTSMRGCASAAVTRWVRSSSSTTSASTPRCSCASRSTRSTRTATSPLPRCSAGWCRPATSARRAGEASTSTDPDDRSVSPLRGDRRRRLALLDGEIDGADPIAASPELGRVQAGLAEHRLEGGYPREGDLLPGDEPRTRRLELQGHRREHQLALRVDQAKLNLVRLSNIRGAEAEPGHHGESRPAWESRHREGAEITA